MFTFEPGVGFPALDPFPQMQVKVNIEISTTGGEREDVGWIRGGEVAFCRGEVAF